MSADGVFEERPPDGGRWLNNAEVDELHRVHCLTLAARMDAEAAAAKLAGDDCLFNEKSADAEEWRATAERWRRRRNHSHEEGVRRALNRSLAAQRSRARWSR